MTFPESFRVQENLDGPESGLKVVIIYSDSGQRNYGNLWNFPWQKENEKGTRFLRLLVFLLRFDDRDICILGRVQDHQVFCSDCEWLNQGSTDRQICDGSGFLKMFDSFPVRTESSGPWTRRNLLVPNQSALVRESLDLIIGFEVIERWSTSVAAIQITAN